MKTFKPTYMRLRQIEFKIHAQREQDGVVFEMPEVGQRFKVWRADQKVFTTSPIESVTRKGDLLSSEWVLKTMNSVYVLQKITPPAYLRPE